MEATGRARLKAATTWWKQQAERDLKQQRPDGSNRQSKHQRPDGSNRLSKTQSSNDLMEATRRERLKAATTWWKQQAEQDLKQQRPDGSNRQSKQQRPDGSNRQRET